MTKNFPESVGLVRVRSQNLILPLVWPNQIENGKLTYFKRGYKKTKAFDVLDDRIPKKWVKLSWLDIAKYTDRYSLEVGEYLADGKTAGIVARQYARDYHKVYSTIKDIIPEDFDPEFFELLRGDWTASVYGMFLFDIVALDTSLGKRDSEYDPENCTYKGEGYSMYEYIQKKYGEDYVRVVKKLTKFNCV